MQKTFKLNNELEINRMAYGAMRLTGHGIMGDPKDRKGAIRLIHEAVELGVNFIDTADSYGPHTNEVLIGEALKGMSSRQVVIATKGGLERPGANQWAVNGDPKHIKDAIEGSLKRLGVERIDLWQLHRVDPRFPIEATLEPVVRAVQAGKIRYVGLSEVAIKEIEEAQKMIPIVSVQNHYNLENRNWESVLEYAHKKGMAFIPWYPLSASPQALSEKVHKIASHHGASNAQVAVSWLLRKSPNIILIPGTSSIDHLRDNLRGAELNLTEEEFNKLSL